MFLTVYIVQHLIPVRLQIQTFLSTKKIKFSLYVMFQTVNNVNNLINVLFVKKITLCKISFALPLAVQLIIALIVQNLMFVLNVKNNFF